MIYGFETSLNRCFRRGLAVRFVRYWLINYLVKITQLSLVFVNFHLRKQHEKCERLLTFFSISFNVFRLILGTQATTWFRRSDEMRHGTESSFMALAEKRVAKLKCDIYYLYYCFNFTYIYVNSQARCNPRERFQDVSDDVVAGQNTWLQRRRAQENMQRGNESEEERTLRVNFTETRSGSVHLLWMKQSPGEFEMNTLLCFLTWFTGEASSWSGGTEGGGKMESLSGLGFVSSTFSSHLQI